MIVNPKNLTAISQLPGIKAIHPMHPKYPSATFSDIDFLKARTASGPAGPWNSGVLGDGIKVADIDSGLDYVHRNFGGGGDYNNHGERCNNRDARNQNISKFYHPASPSLHVAQTSVCELENGGVSGAPKNHWSYII